MALSLRHSMIALTIVTGITSLAGCAGHSRYLGRLETVTLVAYHRMYPAYAETVHVAPVESFPLSDAGYSGRITGYVPDFQIDDRGQVGSRSDEPVNPAFQVEVYEGWKRIDAQWVFANPDLRHARDMDLFVFRVLDYAAREKPANKEAVPTPDTDEGTPP